MKPIDFRNATYADLQERLTGARAAALAAWIKHGPGTTKEVAEKSGLSLLTLRPRTTELLDLGFVTVAEAQPHKGEGNYRAATYREIFDHLHDRRFATIPLQPELALAPLAKTEG